MPTLNRAQAATEVAHFLVAGVRAAHGPRWNQGPRQQPWPVAAGADPAIAVVAQRRLCGVPEPAAHAVWAWHQGRRPVHLLKDIPSPRQVLRWQALGHRCVSILPDAIVRAHGDLRHPDGLSFALHDLCHLEKFVEPEHHVGQVGFFARLAHAMESDDWQALENGFDATWERDRDYVLADMNGSAIFLFAALKMKLKMAVRRHVGLARGHTVPAGPLDPEERQVYEARRERLLELLGLAEAARDDARRVSARRTEPAAAARLLAWFEGAGQQALSAARDVTL